MTKIEKLYEMRPPNLVTRLRGADLKEPVNRTPTKTTDKMFSSIFLPLHALQRRYPPPTTTRTLNLPRSLLN